MEEANKESLLHALEQGQHLTATRLVRRLGVDAVVEEAVRQAVGLSEAGEHEAADVVLRTAVHSGMPPEKVVYMAYQLGQKDMEARWS